jgi:glucokinase
MKHKNLSNVFGANPWGVKSKILTLDYDFKNIIGIDAGGTKTLVLHIDQTILNRMVGRVTGLVNAGCRVYEGNSYKSLDEIIQSYVNEFQLDPKETLLSIAGAGPVHNNSIQMTNRAWSIHADKIENRFHFKKVYLVNDLEAMIYAVDGIEPDHLVTLNRAKKAPHGNIAVISAGTGLGESIGIHLPQKHTKHAVATEGGNGDFAPGDDIEMDLLKYLRRKKDHISWEDVLSGNGLVNIYEFLINAGQAGAEQNSQTRDEMATQNPAEVITARGLANDDAVCRQTLEMFVSMYAAEAGNLALKCLPYGGLYIAGGIAPRLAAIFQKNIFMKRFLNKGRLKPLLETIPVYLVTNPDYAAIGAINHALMNLPG